MTKLVVISWALLLVWVPTALADVEVYSREELTADSKRYKQKFDFLLEKGLWDFMTPNERRALQGLLIKHPLRSKGLLTLEAVVFEGRPMVRAPVSSLKFIEDLSVAYAWRYQNRYSLEPIDEYLAMLKY